MNETTGTPILYRRLRLFLRIIWRRWEPAYPGSRIGWSLAWEVAGIIHPRTPRERVAVRT